VRYVCGKPVLSSHVVGSFSYLFELLGDGERAARLNAAWDKICVDFGWFDHEYVPPEEDIQRTNALRDSIGAEAWQRGQDEGSSWSVQDALAYIARTTPGSHQDHRLG
jgi:hypothetical protein